MASNVYYDVYDEYYELEKWENMMVDQVEAYSPLFECNNESVAPCCAELARSKASQRGKLV